MKDKMFVSIVVKLQKQTKQNEKPRSILKGKTIEQ